MAVEPVVELAVEQVVVEQDEQQAEESSLLGHYVNLVLLLVQQSIHTVMNRIPAHPKH